MYCNYLTFHGHFTSALPLTTTGCFVPEKKKKCWVGLLHCFNSHLPSTETVTLLLFEDYMLNTIFMHVSLTCHHRKLWLVSFLFLPKPKCFSFFVGPPTPNTNTCAWSCESVATWQPSMCVNGDNRWCLERTVAASTARLHACNIDESDENTRSWRMR